MPNWLCATDGLPSRLITISKSRDLKPIVISLAAEHIPSAQHPQQMPEWVHLIKDGVHLTGGLCGFRQTFVHVGETEVTCSRSISELVEHVAALGRLRVDPAGVVHSLESGFVPLPRMVYADFYRLGAGDEMVVTAHEGRIATRVEEDYPWVASKSREDEIPDPNRLFELLCASLERQFKEAGGEAMLAMSSGKDSVAIALAVAELGYDIPCFTYKADATNVEHAYANRFADKLGLKHAVVEPPTDPELVRRMMIGYFENAAAPSVDHALIPLLTLIEQSGQISGGVIDGGGNDGYMGYLSSRTRDIKSRFRIRPAALARAASRLTRVDSKINYLARGDVATGLPGRNLRRHETQQIFGNATDTAGFWQELGDKVAGLDRIDALALSLIRQTEGARSNDKLRFAAPAFGLESLLPFCDVDLADYYFNLPKESRYDEKAGVNKTLLRQLLDMKIGYADSGVGDGYFAFDGASFVRMNEALVRDEILSCGLWKPGIEDRVDGWLEALPQRPFLFHVLVPVFLLSGWYNHSRTLNS